MHTHTEDPIELHVLEFAAKVDALPYNAEYDSNSSDSEDSNRERHPSSNQAAKPQTRLTAPGELAELRKQRSSIGSIEYGRRMKKILVNTPAATPPTSALPPIPPPQIERAHLRERPLPARLQNPRPEHKANPEPRQSTLETAAADNPFHDVFSYNASVLLVNPRTRGVGQAPVYVYQVVEKPQEVITEGSLVALCSTDSQFLHICRKVAKARLSEAIWTEFILEKRSEAEPTIIIGMPLRNDWCAPPV